MSDELTELYRQLAVMSDVRDKVLAKIAAESDRVQRNFKSPNIRTVKQSGEVLGKIVIDTTRLTTVDIDKVVSDVTNDGWHICCCVRGLLICQRVTQVTLQDV